MARISGPYVLQNTTEIFERVYSDICFAVKFINARFKDFFLKIWWKFLYAE